MVFSRILPPRLFVLLAVASVGLGLLLPVVRWAGPPANLLGVPVAVAGLLLAVAGSRAFDRAGANIQTFEEPTALVTGGWFARTRNPMYLGFLIALLGTAVLVGSLSALLGPVGFFLAAQFHYVPFEEERMRETFGADYEEYARHVRRWI
jgi:protein-S-isoprenylcysteine O-methyltransferase Ste14